ncbi:MAG: nucleotidyltransferase family protein [Fimbriimonadaceae bacterium]|nr:nucleotidyltransferase family protein [Fimbriimonadaceae bacterium]
MPGVSAIVLAAGQSARMGGPNKLLMPWHDTTVLGAVLRSLDPMSMDTVVVSGRDREAIAALAAPKEVVWNEDFALGLSTSIRAGVAARPLASGYLIVLGDTPEMRSEVVAAVLEIAAMGGHDAIIAPHYMADEMPFGHPVFFGTAYREDLLKLVGDRGAGPIIAANRDKLITFDVPGRLPDIDRPGDLP